MTTYNKILLGLIAAAYFISPIDIIPDFFIPYLGWFDDTAVIAAIIYYIKYGKIPDYLYKKTAKEDVLQKKETPKSAYQILGISHRATKTDIQAAYRRAVKQYHPDRVAHLGKELQEIANKKFIEIQDAYNTLMNIY